MKKAILRGIFLITLLLAGCNSHQENSIQVSTTIVPKQDIPIELYIPEELPMARYEPEQGVYLGAYVKKNMDLEGEMKNFEQAIGRKQAFTIFQYTPTSPISNQDVLKCIAAKKIPYIKLMLDQEEDMSLVYQMIGELNNRYSTPFFIELFPVTESIQNPVAYKSHYEKAYQLIKRYMEDAVVVWSMDIDRVDEWPIYYPGDYLVDWVGLNVYMPIYKENKKYEGNIMEDIDFWYKSFQLKKPMMLSSLAISHFSRVDHTYTVEEAKGKLQMIYDQLVSAYPRIKGINYIDLDMKQIYPNGKDDYRISVETKLKDYMKEILNNKIFLEEVNEPTKQYATQYIKHSTVAVSIEEKLYLPKLYVEEFLKDFPEKEVAVLEDSSGEKFYPLEMVEKYGHVYYTKK